MTLSPEHIQLLKEKYGIEGQSLPGLKSYTAEEIKKLVGIEAPGLYIEYPGESFTVRLTPPPEGAPKYMRPAGSQPQLYTPPNLSLDTQDFIVLTEGELKAYRAWIGSGMPCCSIAGIWNWRNGQVKDDDLGLLAELDRSWEGKKFLLVYDSDIGAGHQDYDSCFRLGVQILNRKAAEVKVLTLPEIAGLQKVGLDDFLNFYGAEGSSKLQKLQERAIDAKSGLEELKKRKRPAKKAQDDDEEVELDAEQKEIEEELGALSKYKKRALEIAEQGDPLNFILDTFNKHHVGDRNLAKAQFIAFGCQASLSSKGIHAQWVGPSGKGKSDGALVCYSCLPKRFTLIGEITAKSLYYRKEPLPDGLAICLDDINVREGSDLENTIKRSTTRYQDGSYFETLDPQRNLIKARLPKRITWTLTYVSSEDSGEQLLNRVLSIKTDSSLDTDLKVCEHMLDMGEEGTAALQIDDGMMICKAIFLDLKSRHPYRVKIPGLRKIVKFTDPRNRRNPSLFLDLVIGLACLRHRQRRQEVTKDGTVILYANAQDIKEAAELFNAQGEFLGSRLSDAERDVIKYISRDPAGRTVQDITTMLIASFPEEGWNDKKARRMLYGRKDRSSGGLLEKVQGLTYEEVPRKEGGYSQKVFKLVGDAEAVMNSFGLKVVLDEAALQKMETQSPPTPPSEGELINDSSNPEKLENVPITPEEQGKDSESIDSSDGGLLSENGANGDAAATVSQSISEIDLPRDGAIEGELGKVISIYRSSMGYAWAPGPRKPDSTIYLDIETSGDALNIRKAKPEIISIAGDYGRWLLAPDLIQDLIPYLTDPRIRIVCHNAAFDLGVIRAQAKQRLNFGPIWDTMLAHKLLWNGIANAPRASLEAVALHMLGVKLDKTLQVSDWSGDLSDEHLVYSLKDAMTLEPIKQGQKDLLIQAGLMKVAEIEFDTVPAVIDVMLNGLGFDTHRASEVLEDISRKRTRFEHELQDLAKARGWVPPPKKGRTSRVFNPRSTMDVLSLIQQIYGCKLESADRRTLKDILKDHPNITAAKLLLDFREVDKQCSMLKSWREKAEGGRLYPRISQLGAESGRMTMSTPNAQQIPRNPELKSLFVASTGCKLIECDYSAIEMRIAACLSRDEAFLSIFREGKDPHRATAVAIFGTEDISDGQRQIAKTLNFGSLYGGGVNMVRGNLPQLSESEAQGFLKKFYESYPGLSLWQGKISDHAPLKMEGGEVYKISRSKLGRVRYVPPSHRTVLLNNPVQSTGADLLKLAMGRLYKDLATPEYEDVKIVNLVHDSIVLEAPESRVLEASGLLKQVMERAGDDVLELISCKTDTKITSCWGEKE